MIRTSKKLREKYPEIHELIVLINFLFGLISGKNKNYKRSAVKALKTITTILKVYVLLSIPVLYFALIFWGIYDAFRHFLNPLGIENYF